MSKTKHTPGPWKAKRYRGLVSLGRPWHISSSYFSRPGVLDGRDSIAEIMSTDTPEMSEANACLIASAPDLLEVCQAIARLADGQGRMNMMEVAGQARAAIAKAEGK